MRDPRQPVAMVGDEIFSPDSAGSRGPAVQRRPRFSVPQARRAAAGLSCSLLLLVLGLAIAGCQSTSPGGSGDDMCSRAVSAYQLYQASLATGREPSKDERTAAAAAAAYLQLRCGWTPVATRGLASDAEIPVLRPPSR